MTVDRVEVTVRGADDRGPVPLGGFRRVSLASEVVVTARTDLGPVVGVGENLPTAIATLLRALANRLDERRGG